MAFKSEVERMLIQDIRFKKKVGSGSFHKKGKGVKHGIVGGMRTHADLLTGKAKREYQKSGDVQVFNVKDIISKEEFYKKPEADQKMLLEAWRDAYTNETIVKKSGMNKTELQNLVTKFNLIRKGARGFKGNKTTYSPEEIEHFKNNFMDFESFLTLKGEQKAEVMNHYSEQFSSKELAEMWGVDIQNVYAHRSYAKQSLKKKEKEQEAKKQEQKKPQKKVAKIVNEPIQDIFSREEIDKEPILDQLPEIVNENPEITNDVPVSNHGREPEPEQKAVPVHSTYEINGVYSAESLANKLEKLIMLISGESSHFSINIKLEEIEKNQEEIQEEVDKEKLQELFTTLASILNK